MALTKATKLLNFFQNKVSEAKVFEKSILLNIQVDSAKLVDNGSEVNFKLPVLKEFCNSYGPLHGGAITTIIDETTGLAILTADKSPRELTSIDLSVSFASAAAEGDQLFIKTRCNKVGKNLAFASADLWVGSKLIAEGKHICYMFNTKLEF